MLGAAYRTKRRVMGVFSTWKGMPMEERFEVCESLLEGWY